MAATFTLWKKHMTRFFRSPEAAFGMLMQPILWVLLFGVGMQALLTGGGMDMGLPGAIGSDYTGFIIPGIIVLSALAGAVAGGSTLLDERLRGVIKEYLAAPIPRYSVLLANALSTATRGLFQAVVIALLGLVLGAGLQPDPLGWLLAVLYLTLYAVGIAGLALAVAARVSSSLGYHGLIALDLPLFFASSALYPVILLPGWMGWIARLNPTTYVIDAVRDLLYGITYPGQAGLGLAFAVTLGFALLGMTLATLSFRAEVRKTGGAI